MEKGTVMKNTKSSIFSISPKRYFLSAVIVAAGSGTRMGSSVPKQFLPLRDVPVIIRTLQQFEKSALVREIIVVARPEDIAWYPPYIEQYSLSKVKKIVPGGATRQLSALLGLQAISDRSKFIAIHDGARCLIQPEQIDEVARQAFSVGAAAAACRSKDTTKLADANGKVMQTLDRKHLWQVQTPQTFKTELYRACAYTAKANGFSATDDCALAEALGFAVQLVDCGYQNIKITTPEDLLFADAILSARAEKKIC